MKLNIYGAGKEVGRSLFTLEEGGRKIGIDAGIKLGKTIEFPEIEEKDIAENIIISHSHLDHVGYLVHIKKDLNIYSTKPTRDLMPVLIGDYSRLSKIEFDPNSLVKKTEILHYHEKTKINGFEVELYKAGHILGSSMIKIGEVLYTGDFNLRSSRILDPGEYVKAKTVIMESTYAGNEDIIPPMKQEFSRLVEIINKTIEKGGVVLIPSFAIGRAQEILIALDAFLKSGRIRKVPIYVDGMIKKAMKIYRMNVIYAKKDIQNQILMSLHDPFRSKNFKISRDIDRRDVKGPAIIVTTSGMLTGGPIYKYLQLFGNDENSTLVFVGYQAEGTPGRAILEGKKQIIINEKEIEIKMKIERIKISGHSDRNDLIRFINTIKPERIVLVHGEKNKQEELAAELEKKYEVMIPENGEEIEI